MFGIEFTEFLLFIRLLAMGVAGAASFWGCVFLFRSRRTQGTQESALWGESARNLLWVFFPSLLLYAVVWGILAFKQCVFCVRAHEGISLVQDKAELILSMQNQYFFFLAIISVAILGLGAFILARKSLFTHLWLLYGVSFILISILLLHSWGSFESARQNKSTQA